MEDMKISSGGKTPKIIYFKAAYNEHSGHQGRDFTTTHLSSDFFLNLEEDFRTPLLMFSPWLSSQNHTEDTSKIGYPLGVKSGPPFELHLHTLSFVDAVLSVWRNFLGHFPFTNCQMTWVGSCLLWGWHSRLLSSFTSVFSLPLSAQPSTPTLDFPWLISSQYYALHISLCPICTSHVRPA